ncbi:LysM peptidoglycan-binding domain-containing protein, partial [Bradyrhizobium sp. Arg68]|uniref:LysM peptidoglycan-binding domain-containing protein n=2 Tax=Bradyrhizobium TaxID=374 RepID=UPI001E377133
DHPYLESRLTIQEKWVQVRNKWRRSHRRSSKRSDLASAAIVSNWRIEQWWQVVDRPLAAGAQQTAKKEECSDAQSWSDTLQRAAQPDIPRVETSRGDDSRIDRASAAPNRPARSNTANDNIIEHRVKDGESLWSISRQYDRPFPDVLKANPQVRDPDRIQPGDTVRIPLGSPPRPTAAPSTSTPSVPPSTGAPSTP